MVRAWAAIISAIAVVLALGAPGAHAATAPKVVKRALTFEVGNVDRSALACRSDGRTYKVSGRLIGPAGAADAATLYLHGYGFAGWFWDFAAVPRYDYAVALARAGHTSIVIDRLGYGASDHPEGTATCLGAQADIAHQIVSELRSADYAVKEGEPQRFGRVALAGHSTGALIANVEAISFGDVDALLAIGYTPQVTRDAFEQFYVNRTICLSGTAPGGYAYFGQTDAEYRTSAFHSVDAAVAEAATRLRPRDPCGDTASIVDALVLDVKSLARVAAPVLVVCGREDAVTPDFACPHLARRYSGSKDVSLAFVRRAGHALTLERTAPAFRRRVSAWLGRHGF